MKNADVILLLQEKLPSGHVVDWYETINMILENLPGDPEFDIVDDEFIVTTGDFAAAFKSVSDGIEIKTLTSFGDKPSGYRMTVPNDLKLVKALEALYNKAQYPEYKPSEVSSLDRYYFSGANTMTRPRRRRQAGRMPSEDLTDFKRYLGGTVIVAGEGSITLYDTAPGEKVTAAIVHDGSGYTPAAAIYVSQWESEDECLQAAYEILELWQMENYPEYYDELVADYGQEQVDNYGMFTETFDGMVWTGLNAKGAADAIEADEYAKQYVDIEWETYEEEDEDYAAFASVFPRKREALWSWRKKPVTQPVPNFPLGQYLYGIARAIDKARKEGEHQMTTGEGNKEAAWVDTEGRLNKAQDLIMHAYDNVSAFDL